MENTEINMITKRIINMIFDLTAIVPDVMLNMVPYMITKPSISIQI